MTKIITSTECISILEQILKNAIENGNFDYKVNVSEKAYDFNKSTTITIVIVGSECTTKEIYVDTDYTALDNEEVRVCEVTFSELFSEFSQWSYLPQKLYVTQAYDKVQLTQFNFLITQLMIAQMLKQVRRMTIEEYKNSLPAKNYSRISSEMWYITENADNVTVYVCKTQDSIKVYGNIPTFLNSIIKTKNFVDMAFFVTKWGELKKLGNYM